MKKQNKKLTLKKFVLLFWGCVLVFSCENSKTIPTINLNDINQSISLNLEDMLKDISMVQISSDIMLSADDQIYVTSQYLIILINRQSLHLFRKDGEHIRKIAERGNGPGEFNSINKFFVDEDERVLYYIDHSQVPFRLNRIDIHSGKVLEPLPIDFNFLTVNYINGKVYSLPSFRYAGRSIVAGTFPDSAVVACSISLPYGEMEKYKGHHSYSYLQLGATIASYYDEVVLLNYDYSDTLFTLKNNQLSPLCILHIPDKMKNTADGGSGCEIIADYNKGLVLSKINLVTMSPRPGVLHSGREFALYDKKGGVFKIDNINVMGMQINFPRPEDNLRLSSFLPVICGNYAYMLFEHDFFETQPAGIDPDNDKPIIIVGTLK